MLHCPIGFEIYLPLLYQILTQIILLTGNIQTLPENSFPNIRELRFRLVAITKLYCNWEVQITAKNQIDIIWSNIYWVSCYVFALVYHKNNMQQKLEELCQIETVLLLEAVNVSNLSQEHQVCFIRWIKLYWPEKKI